MIINPVENSIGRIRDNRDIILCDTAGVGACRPNLAIKAIVWCRHDSIGNDGASPTRRVVVIQAERMSELVRACVANFYCLRDYSARNLSADITKVGTERNAVLTATSA